MLIEQEKSESLLLNILPAPIARRLKDSQDIIADGFADVTVMFADIIDFTRLSEELPPRAMVELLNEVFSKFDSMAEFTAGENQDHRRCLPGRGRAG